VEEAHGVVAGGGVGNYGIGGAEIDADNIGARRRRPARLGAALPGAAFRRLFRHA